MNKERSLQRLREIDRELVLYEQIAALLGWDQETNMPEAAVQGRADQQTLLSGMLHDKITDPEIGSLLEDLGASDAAPEGDASLDDIERGLVRTYYRTYSRQMKLPKRLVEELAEATSIGQPSWAHARSQKDFSLFRPHLERIVELKREVANIIGYQDHPYDALLDEYEPGMKTNEVSRVFSGLRDDIVELLGKIREKDPIDDEFLYRTYDKALQDEFGRIVLADMGFDFERGILSESAHPFTTTLGMDDIRITTRYNEPAMSSAFFSTIHEGGHALYEMGASTGVLKGCSLGTGTSLAVHESQSRFWENMVGRSVPFWTHYYPILEELFPDPLHGVDRDLFIRGVNKVAPSMIRVNADEVTYSLHVILRFEIEKKLVAGDLSVAELPEYWNESMRQMLGIVPANDAEGVLQDVHWSAGLIGYFPTYALGNLYGAQFFESLKLDIPDHQERIQVGDLKVLKQWLFKKIHQHGSVYTAGDLLKRVTGKELDPKHFSRYLNEKYTKIYDL